MKIAICDDLLADRTRLQRIIEDFFAGRGITPRISAFESADELLNGFEKHAWQIVFMDIYMEGISGVDASRRIRAADRSCAIIFTTTSPDHAMAGYEVKASDYLLKPFTAEDVAVSLEWALQNLQSAARTVEVISDRAHLQISVSEILYVEVFRRECEIHLADGRSVSTNRTLGAFAEELGDDFLRCHRSYLVNMAFIQKPLKDAFLLQNGERVPIGADIASDGCRDYFEWAFRRTWEGK